MPRWGPAAMAGPSRSQLPVYLYAVNGLLPLAICFAQDMVLAGVLGTVAMAIPLVATLRGSRQPHAGAPSVPSMAQASVSSR